MKKIKLKPGYHYGFTQATLVRWAQGRRYANDLSLKIGARISCGHWLIRFRLYDHAGDRNLTFLNTLVSEARLLSNLLGQGLTRLELGLDAPRWLGSDEGHYDRALTLYHLYDFHLPHGPLFRKNRWLKVRLDQYLLKIKIKHRHREYTLVLPSQKGNRGALFQTSLATALALAEAGREGWG